MVFDERVYGVLVDRARAHQTAFYSDLGGSRRWIGKTLDEINKSDRRRGKPMISALVLSKATKRPSRGFYDCASDLGLWREGDDEELFWQRQRDAIYKEFGDQSQS